MSRFASSPATIRLGDLEVPRLGFGAMQLPGPGVWGEPKDPERARAVLRRVIELGIGLIDTSWYYGPLVANRLIAEVLHPYPKGLVIATKLGGKRTPDKGWQSAVRPEELQKGCEEDLQSLRVEQVDVCHLRWMHSGDVSFAESLDAMIALKNQGKVRHIGLSNVTLAQVKLALERTPVVSVQNLYNVAAGERRLASLAHAVVHEQEQLVDLCAKRGIAFLPFFPLAVPGGNKPVNAALAEVATRLGKSESQVALAWLLARSPVILPIPGTSSPEHLEENWSARELELTPDDLAAISRARS
jgi:aryl-alcohol dehydrogenase-like predicted oxidoreductase